MAKRVIRVRITRDSRDNNGDNRGIIKIMKNGDYPVYSMRIGLITRTPPPPPSIKQLQFLEQVNLHIIPLYSTILSYTPQIPYTIHQIINHYPPRPSMNSIGLNLDTL